MEYRELGKTGLRLSALSYGASPLGGVFGAIDESEGIRCVHAALDGGINYVDVSPYYGDTLAETVLGRALRGVGRERYLLSTKVGRYGGGVFDFSAPRVTRSIDESLGRLGVDHVDLLIAHDIEFGDLNQIVEETLPAMREIVAHGKARFVGVSGLPLAIFGQVLARTDLDFVLSYCHHTLTDTSLDTLLPTLRARGIGAINAAPLGMGLLSGAPLPDWHPAPPALRKAVRQAAEWCRGRVNVELADLAVAWSVQARTDIATTIVGSASVAQIERSIRAAESVPDGALFAEIRTLLQPVRDLTWPNGHEENDPPERRSVAPSDGAQV